MVTDNKTINELYRALVAGETTAAALAEHAIALLNANQHLNAVVTTDITAFRDSAAGADAQARAGQRGGPLHGIPLVLKDNINTRSLATSGCTPALQGNVPHCNAGAASRLLAAGALLLGKTNMHELAFGITNNHGAFGAARNPYDPDRVPGGSSGGTAAAIAARVVRGGLGTDTGGSTRIPAAFCGICGFRPTIGRYPGDGIIPISHSRDTPGPMAAAMDDLIILDAVLAGTDSSTIEINPGEIRLGVPRPYYFEDLAPDVADTTEQALQCLRDAGVRLIETEVGQVGALNDAVGFPVALFEAKTDMQTYLAEFAPQISIDDLVAGITSPDVREIYHTVVSGAAVSGEMYQAALQVHRPRLQKAFADCFEKDDLDAIVLPTTILTAPRIGDDETVEHNGERVPTMPTVIHNTDPSSNAGIPSLSVPSGLGRSGLPVGLCFEGPAGSDSKLLAIGRAFETFAGTLPAPGET